jgi:dihydroorotate dehydrogenase electron transfer subunit
MTRTTLDNIARPGRFTAAVVKKTDLSRRYYLLVLERPAGFAFPEPGTFIHLLPPGPGRFFMRRPFSVLDCDESTVSLLIVEKGAGTAYLRSMPEGAAVDFIGPLGNSFPRLPGKRILAIGGGVGLAPLYLYRSALDASKRGEYRLLYGARTKEDLFIERFDWRFTGVGYATDDGSHGFAGSVVDLAAREMETSSYDAIFSCGPMPMIAAADRLAKRKAVRHYVSLENRMGCGMGACRSCVVPVREAGVEKYRTVCHDGPVFDANDLVWEKLPSV